MNIWSINNSTGIKISIHTQFCQRKKRGLTQDALKNTRLESVVVESFKNFMNRIFNLECNCSFKDLFNKSHQRKCVGGLLSYIHYAYKGYILENGRQCFVCMEQILSIYQMVNYCLCMHKYSEIVTYDQRRYIVCQGPSSLTTIGWRNDMRTILDEMLVVHGTNLFEIMQKILFTTHLKRIACIIMLKKKGYMVKEGGSFVRVI